jgi:predicted Zn-dependent protease
MGVLNAAEFLSYLDAFGQRLAIKTPRQDVTRVHVADMAEPNAVARPGGDVCVSRKVLA